MDKRYFEIDMGRFLLRCSVLTMIGSLVSAWVFIIVNYFSTINSQGYYSAPLSIFTMQLLCLPICGYQLPAYFISGFVFIKLGQRNVINSPIIIYLCVGATGCFFSALLLSIMNINGSSFDPLFSIFMAVLENIPTLLLYLFFFFPKHKLSG